MTRILRCVCMRELVPCWPKLKIIRLNAFFDSVYSEYTDIDVRMQMCACMDINAFCKWSHYTTTTNVKQTKNPQTLLSIYLSLSVHKRIVQRFSHTHHKRQQQPTAAAAGAPVQLCVISVAWYSFGWYVFLVRFVAALHSNIHSHVRGACASALVE